jgi:hypothetical protein
MISKKNGRKYDADFCSIGCCNRHRRLPLIPVCCEQCGKTFIKVKSHILKTKHNFCTKSCAAKYNNAHKTKGTRVSKLERWIAEQLPSLFPALDFHFNRKDAIKGELDIYVPSLRLAFELNGIFHYEPIYGPEKLGQIQNNDERKMQACVEHGIELCLIDTSSVTYFKPEKAQKYLSIISGIIHPKVSRICQRMPLLRVPMLRIPVVQSEPRGGSLTFRL